MSEAATILESLGATVSRLVSDSRRIMRGDAFAAYPGERLDGRQFIPDAISRGAGSVLWERDNFRWNANWHLPNRGVENLKRRLSEIADVVYGHPSQKLWTIGVTGTSGKSSCAFWIAEGLGHIGKKTALMGTLGFGFIPFLESTANTTPDAAELQALLKQMLCDQAQAVVMEVSSHGLEQGRVDAIKFDVALFTNLSRDHLDYHGSMAAYGAAKARLMQWPTLRTAVINADDEFGRELISRHSKGDLITYGLHRGDVRAEHLLFSTDGVAMVIASPWGRGEIRSDLVGSFNAANLLGVLAVLIASGSSLDDSLQVIAGFRSVRGRMQRLGGRGRPLVIVDYAHKPDALEKVLQTLRANCDPGGRLVCVFGCGGGRDPGKRPMMGGIAARLADRVIITSDNPRGEDPSTIIDAIVSGVSPEALHKVSLEPDRARAIAEAIRDADANDVVLLAGKGHETYQEIAGERREFSDTEQAENALKRWAPKR